MTRTIKVVFVLKERPTSTKVRLARRNRINQINRFDRTNYLSSNQFAQIRLCSDLHLHSRYSLEHQRLDYRKPENQSLESTQVQHLGFEDSPTKKSQTGISYVKPLSDLVIRIQKKNIRTFEESRMKSDEIQMLEKSVSVETGLTNE